MNDRNIVLIILTGIICLLIIGGTFYLLSSATSANANDNNNTNLTNNTADGNGSVEENLSKTSEDMLNQEEESSNIVTITNDAGRTYTGEQVGDVVHAGHKNYYHAGCGGHIIYDGKSGGCVKCGAQFNGDYEI